MRDLWGYHGKRVVINGGSSGMGLAAMKLLLELGAEVYLLDIKEPPTGDLPAPLKKFLPIDLRKKESIDAALRQIPDPIDKVFACAGVPGAPFPDIDVMLVNFVGQRHMIESLIPRMVDGGGHSASRVHRRRELEKGLPGDRQAPGDPRVR